MKTIRVACCRPWRGSGKQLQLELRYTPLEQLCLDDKCGSKMPKLCWWSWGGEGMPKQLQGERLLMCSGS